MIQAAHSLDPEAVVKHLQSNMNEGLSSAESATRLRRHGRNILSRKKPKSVGRILLEQLLSPIVYILAGAMLFAIIFNHYFEAVAILLVLIINTLIGFYMEYKAIRSFVALKKMVETVSRVIRDSKEQELPSRNLVPGDIILIREGDVIPADARLIELKGLLLKESMLTGESEQVEKNINQLPPTVNLTEQVNMVFNGTIVTRGNAKAIITKTGDHSAIGQISRMTQEGGEKRTPLQKKLNFLTNWLIIFTVILAALIVVTGLMTSNDPELMLKTGIALAVAAIPEGLPVVATITLARGMLRLSKKKVIIKELESVQTLGETNIICTDKTGTLTDNKMTVKVIQLSEEKILLEDIVNSHSKDNPEGDLSELLRVAVLCNNAIPGKSEKQGDAIDEALMEFANGIGHDIQHTINTYPEEFQLPFDADLKLMATINGVPNAYLVCVKGAPENVYKHCKSVLDKGKIVNLSNSQEWENRVEKLAAEGYKVLAFAGRNTSNLPDNNILLEDLVLYGIVGFLDPPREDIKQAIQIYNDAGIQVKMLTGDHPGTAKNIAQAIGLVHEGMGAEKVIMGSDFQNFESLEEKDKELVLNATVFARFLPKQKLELVRFLQKNKGVVGMLGDGVNDAPALREADIGIAMGIRGTEAAKEVADVILMDDKFTAIKLAIHQGRAIFENIRYFVIFLISCNLAEVISVSIASFINLPLPLLPMQILYLNLITDIFPALALGMGKGSKGIMNMRPRPSKEAILTRSHWVATVVYGLSVTFSVIGVVIYANSFLDLSEIEVNNMAFNTLVLAQLLNIFNLPARKTSFFINEVTMNPWVWLALVISIVITVMGYFTPFLSNILSLESLVGEQVVISVLFAFGSLILSQIIKRVGLIRI